MIIATESPCPLNFATEWAMKSSCYLTKVIFCSNFDDPSNDKLWFMSVFNQIKRPISSFYLAKMRSSASNAQYCIYLNFKVNRFLTCATRITITDSQNRQNEQKLKCSIIIGRMCKSFRDSLSYRFASYEKYPILAREKKTPPKAEKLHNSNSLFLSRSSSLNAMRLTLTAFNSACNEWISCNQQSRSLQQVADHFLSFSLPLFCVCVRLRCRSAFSKVVESEQFISLHFLHIYLISFKLDLRGHFYFSPLLPLFTYYCNHFIFIANFLCHSMQKKNYIYVV